MIGVYRIYQLVSATTTAALAGGGGHHSRNKLYLYTVPTKEATMTPRPPRDPYYRRYWGYANRPYGGCGCLYGLLLFFLFWWILALFIPGLALWGPYF